MLKRTTTRQRAGRFLAAVLILTGVGVAAVIDAGAAHANPGQCGSGYTPWGGGGFCDGDQWPDGSVLHHENVCVLGFCGGNTFRACLTPDGRVPTDNDPATPC